MKWLAVGLVMVVICLAHAQPTPEWTSPQGSDSLQMGWVILRITPAIDYRFYQWDRSALSIMSRPYDVTPAITIPLTTGEREYYGDGFYPWISMDLSGDGIFDLVLHRRYGAAFPYREGFRVVNTVTGQDIYEFDAPNASYRVIDITDFDNDGLIELAVGREPYPPTQQRSYTIEVFQTGGRSTAAFETTHKQTVLMTLQQNFPNPFNPTTRIQYDVSQPGIVAIEIVDINGRLVRRFNEQPRMAGHYEVIWDGRDESGLPAATGTYFYRMLSQSSSSVRKMILLK